MGVGHSAAGTPAKPDLPSAAVNGLRMALLLTLALIWPLQDKPAFSLQAGYGTPEFIVAAVILGWIAAFFSLFGARRSRLFSLVGEQLSSLVRNETPDTRPASGLLLRHACDATWCSTCTATTRACNMPISIRFSGRRQPIWRKHWA